MRLSFLGLVVGSIAPDAGYYIGRFDLASAAHTPPGLLTICLPVGLVLTAFVRAMRRPVSYLMPHANNSAAVISRIGRAPTQGNKSSSRRRITFSA